VLYGFVYAKTVATFPRGIFVLTAALLTVALVLLFLVQPPTPGEDDVECVSLDETQVPEIRVTITREDTLVHIDEDEGR